MIMSSTHLSRKPIAIVDNDNDSYLVEKPDSPLAHPKYQYTELPYGDHIRLLELLPGDSQSSLHCRLQIINLNSFYIPKYEALSYTWGDSKYDHLIIAGERISLDSGLHQEYAVRHPIYCGESRLLIATNLRDALRRLRHPTLPTKLWVDALCINQEDDSEKSRQIMLMPRIYHSSKQVWLWVGGEDEGSGTAFKVLRWLASEYIAQMLSFKEVPTEKTLYDADAMTALRLPTFESGSYQHVTEVFQRPVFRRMWCVQEVVSHKKVVLICGPKTGSSLPYEKLIHAIKYLEWTNWKKELEKHYYEGKNLLAFVQAEQDGKRNWDGNILDRYAVAYDLRNFQATDPRDKIYGLLGLLGNFAHRGLDDLTFDNRDDPCATGHALDCAHNQEKTSNFAQNKWEAGQAENVLNYAANSRIYQVKSDLSALLSITIDFAKNVLGLHYGENTDDTVYRFDLPAGLDSYRAEIDAHLVNLWDYFAHVSLKHVSSDELVANRFASELLEHLLAEYEKLYNANINERFFQLGNTQQFLEWLEKMLRLMRGVGEYNSDYDSADEDEAVANFDTGNLQLRTDGTLENTDGEVQEVVAPTVASDEKKEDGLNSAPSQQSNADNAALTSRDQDTPTEIGSLSLITKDEVMNVFHTDCKLEHDHDHDHDHDHVSTCQRRFEKGVSLADETEAQICCLAIRDDELNRHPDMKKDELNGSDKDKTSTDEITECAFVPASETDDTPPFDISTIAGFEYMKERVSTEAGR
jgi:hypothetical protein